MKYLSYILLAIVIVFTLTSALGNPKDNTKTITLQCTAKNAGSADLNHSAEIIRQRLKQYGLDNISISVPGNGQLTVVVPENINTSEIEGLLTSRGDISFYETYGHEEITRFFKADDELFKLLNLPVGQKASDPRIGCCSPENSGKVDEYLKTIKPVGNSLFRWSSGPGKNGLCLFALKVDNNGKALMGRSDIDSVKLVRSLEPGNWKIQIRLKSAAAGIFAEATRINLHKSIVIAIDGKVYSWPTVQNVIEGGSIEITGDFTENEVKTFPVLFNSEQLPVGFRLSK
jgi:preprotein translocase subunit SecD